MKAIIRTATIEDVPAIAEIELATSPEPWSENALLNDVSSNGIACVIVADMDGEVVGYADVWKVADELQLNNIAVSEEYRGNHIAQEMLEVLAEMGRELDCISITLEVRESNVPARGLYEKLGFKIVGERADYYIDNGETAILMDRYL